MASEWFYKVMGEEVGPVSTDKFKLLAEGGVIERDTLVRKGPDGTWVLAERVQGLFSAPSAPLPSTVKAPLAAKLKPPDFQTAQIKPPDSTSAARLRQRLVFVGILTGAAVAFILLAVLVLRARRLTNGPVAKTESGVLRVRDTVLKVHVWSDVFYQAMGKGEDPTDSFIRQANLIQSAVKETERLLHIYQEDNAAVDEAGAAHMAVMEELTKAAEGMHDETLLQQNEDRLRRDWLEKEKQSDQDLQRCKDWNKHVDEMTKEYERIKQKCEVYEARSTLAPIQFSYNLGSGWKDAVVGVERDIFVPVDGKPQMLQVMISNPDICSFAWGRNDNGEMRLVPIGPGFARHDNDELCLVPIAPGSAALQVAVCGQRLEIPIKVIVLPCKYGDTVDKVIAELGLPDNKRVADGVEQWMYNRWPKAVLIISSDKTLFTVRTGAESPKDSNG